MERYNRYMYVYMLHMYIHEKTFGNFNDPIGRNPIYQVPYTCTYLCVDAKIYEYIIYMLELVVG